MKSLWAFAILIFVIGVPAMVARASAPAATAIAVDEPVFGEAQTPAFQFKDINGAFGGGGVTVIYSPNTGNVGIIGSPMGGTGARAHYIEATRNLIITGDGNFAMVIGAARREGDWQSAAGIEGQATLGMGLSTPGAVRIFGMGTAAIDTSAIYRGPVSNFIEGSAGVEAGVAIVDAPVFLTFSGLIDADGYAASREPNLGQLREGVRVRADLGGWIFLRVDLHETLGAFGGAAPNRSGHAYLDFKVCKMCVVGLNFKTRKISPTVARPEGLLEYTIGIDGGLGF